MEQEINHLIEAWLPHLANRWHSLRLSRNTFLEKKVAESFCSWVLYWMVLQ